MADDPKMEGYIPLQQVIDTDQDESSRRIRDMPYGKRKEEVQFSTLELSFAETGTGFESAALAVVLTNSGYAPVNIYGHTLEGPFELKSAIPSVLEPGETAAVAVSFKPTVIGSLTGSLYIDTGDAAGDELVQLIGVAVPGDLGIPATDSIKAILKMTQSDYNALLTKDAQTLYIIVG